MTSVLAQQETAEEQSSSEESKLIRKCWVWFSVAGKAQDLKDFGAEYHSCQPGKALDCRGALKRVGEP